MRSRFARWQHCWEGWPVWSLAGTMASIPGEVGTVFRGEWYTGEGKAAKRRATLLSVMGPVPNQLLRSLLSPMKLTNKSFEELVAILTGQHYNPLPSEVMQRFCFDSRLRKTGEFVAAYIAKLHCLVEFCNYGAILDKMLRDWLIWGVNDESIQKKLLQEKNLTLQQA